MKVSDIDIKSLRVFCAVVENSGFVGAQSALYASQASVSTHIKLIEDRLGFRLCERGRKGFFLTDKGQTAYEKAKGVLHELDSFARDMGELLDRLTGTIRIGVVDSTITNPDFVLVRALRRFGERVNDVQIHLIVASPIELQRELLCGNLDVVIGPLQQRVEGFSYDSIYRERHALYCGRQHPLYARANGKLHLADVTGLPSVSRSYLGPDNTVLHELLRPTAFVSNMEAQATLIMAGHHLGYLPEHYARAWVEREDLRLLAIPRTALDSTFFLVAREKPHRPKVVDVMLDDFYAELSAQRAV